MKEEIGDKNGVATLLGNIGIAYGKLKDYPKALDYDFKALKMAEELGDKNGISRHLSNIGVLYAEQTKYAEAETYLLDALKIDKEIGVQNGERQVEEFLSNLYEETGQHKDALLHYKNAMVLKDTLFSQENKKQLIKKEMNFEFEKKEIAAKAEQDKKDALTAEASRRERLIRYSVIGGLLLMMVIAVIIFRSLRITRKQKAIIDEAYTELDVKNKEIEEQKKIVEEHHKDIIDSINYAERIQRSFIATKEILNENLNDYFVFFKPKDIVSGDFYWASKLNNGNFALVTADSTGHGVPGAIMSLLNVTSLEKAIETETQPSDILNSTRKIIIDRLKKDGSAEGGKDGMDASLTIYDFKNKKLIIAAANNPVWIVRGTETIEIKPDKMPVGKHDKDTVSFTQQEIELKSGDVVYTLTDGFPDQFGGEKGKKFLNKNLRELLSANSQLPMNEQKELLETTFKNWVGNLEQVDDVTLIGIKI
jgi:serine phosphatase RsbU (regulator of sigma subunit)